jgi:hypothetical protein
MRNIDWRSLLINIAGDVSIALNLNIVAENYILASLSFPFPAQRPFCRARQGAGIWRTWKNSLLVGFAQTG